MLVSKVYDTLSNNSKHIGIVSWMEPNQFMNLNEECLLSFLNNPGRLDSTTAELQKLIFNSKSTIILNNISKDKTLKLSQCLKN